MREKLARFMAGRNGGDQLNRFLSGLICILLLLSVLLDGELARMLWVLAILGMVWVYFRMFSRRLDKRRAENARYLQRTARARAWLRGLRERWTQRREYKFFRCPSCRTMLRVPRGKGRLKVVCRKCGNSFFKNS